MIHWQVGPTIFQYPWYMWLSLKSVGTTFQCRVVLQSRGKDSNSCWYFMIPGSQSATYLIFVVLINWYPFCEIPWQLCLPPIWLRFTYRMGDWCASSIKRDVIGEGCWRLPVKEVCPLVAQIRTDIFFSKRGYSERDTRSRRRRRTSSRTRHQLSYIG